MARIVVLLAVSAPAHSFLKGFDFLDTESPGRACSVHGREGVCMYSMVCSFAGGRHLGTCRDRFIFGSCCRLPDQQPETEWQQKVNTLPLHQVCGRRWEKEEPRLRIQGGEVANRTAWPWQAAVRLRYSFSTSSFTSPSSSLASLSSHHCGAVLLNHHWAATAAHCVYKKSLKKLLVVLGDHNNEAPEAGEELRGVNRVQIHPKYSPRNFDNDLALLRLDRPVAFTRHILPLCLPPPGLKVQGRRGYVTGWGSIYDGGPQPSLLNQVEVPLLSSSECNSLFKLASLEEHLEDDIWVCAGYLEGGRDACEGDSGGPLAVVVNSGGETVWALAGIISWGPNSCGEKNRPGVYTRVGNYLGWVRDSIEEQPYSWTRASFRPSTV